ncbi:MAG TPA: transposase [Candidatus Babeliaceae bacterium]|nr:transposase [Candidatus Babeliaceae bacterium]
MAKLDYAYLIRVIREEFPELREFLWGGKSFWVGGYFAETSGQVSEDRILDYINNNF